MILSRTINYERSQLNRVRGGKIKVKITSSDGETNWISIQSDTFEAIKTALTKQGNE
jgi:hypothetical protein